MRRILSSILILFVFCTLQYGKIATYLYCKWQTELVQQKKDCGCESHLISMFDQEHADGTSTTMVKEIAVEYTNGLPMNALLPIISLLSISPFAEYDASLLQYYRSPAFRPPAV
ncbi:MAG: hypothetical protein ACKVOW_07395 [Chitinophagaceae bacterium]